MEGYPIRLGLLNCHGLMVVYLIYDNEMDGQSKTCEPLTIIALDHMANIIQCAHFSCLQWPSVTDCPTCPI